MQCENAEFKSLILSALFEGAENLQVRGGGK